MVENQNYCMINKTSNICENVCIWNGDPNTWTPPSEYLMIIQANTPAKVWSFDRDLKVWEIVERMGGGGIGFTWDGTFLTTSDPMPPIPEELPILNLTK